MGVLPFRVLHRGSRWSVTEIRDPQELLAEGRELGHCIFSYRDRLQRGESAVFSLRRDGRRHGTIEVRPSRRWVSEAKGRANAVLVGHAAQVLHLWALARRITVTT